MGGINFLPVPAVSDEGIEHDEHLAHGRYLCHLLRFATGYESLVEGPDVWIRLRRRQRGHIEHGSYAGSPTPGRPSATEGAAVTVERCYTDERGNLST